MTRTGEKHYKCSQDCSYSTVHKCHDLNSHVMTHAGVKPFKCDETNCNYATASKRDLPRHYRSCKPTKCSITKLRQNTRNA